MELSKEDLALHEEMSKKLPELVEEYFKRPEITSVGVSLKTVNDKLINSLSYTFGVKKKLPLSQVDTPIPSKIFGYPTDVIEFEIQPNNLSSPDAVADTTRNEKTDPLIGGISISADGEIVDGGKSIAASGTLGVMMNKKGDENPYMLTCAHVVAGSTTQLNSDICQQSKWETTLYYCHNCATLTSYYYGNVSLQRNSVEIQAYLDCAIAKKGWFRNVTIGKVYGISNIIKGFADITPDLIGKEVVKSGISTEVTLGNVTSINTSAKRKDFEGKNVDAQNIIMVRGQGGAFGTSGDSGSVVFKTDDSMMIGVLFGIGESSGLGSVSAADAILSQWPDLSF